MKRRKVREVVRRLVSKTLEVLEEDPELAERLAKLARRIRLKARIKQPYELKILFCKKCKSFAPPPIYSKIRIRKGWLIITCLKCGGIYRKRVKFKTSIDKQKLGRIKNANGIRRPSRSANTKTSRTFEENPSNPTSTLGYVREDWIAC